MKHFIFLFIFSILIFLLCGYNFKKLPTRSKHKEKVIAGTTLFFAIFSFLILIVYFSEFWSKKRYLECFILFIFSLSPLLFMFTFFQGRYNKKNIRKFLIFGSWLFVSLCIYLFLLIILIILKPQLKESWKNLFFLFPISEYETVVLRGSATDPEIDPILTNIYKAVSKFLS